MEVAEVVLGSIIGAGTALVVMHFEGVRWRQDALVSAMQFLTGKSQKRSAGIGIIEALILGKHVRRKVRYAVDNVLWNQLIYLAYHGEIERRHENINARRLISHVRSLRNRNELLGYSDAELAEIERRVKTAVSAHSE